MLIPLTRTSGSTKDPLQLTNKDMTITVIVKNNNVEKAIRTLKKKVLKEGLLKEIKQRQYYEKPTLKRQRRHKEK